MCIKNNSIVNILIITNLYIDSHLYTTVLFGQSKTSAITARNWINIPNEIISNFYYCYDIQLHTKFIKLLSRNIF